MAKSEKAKALAAQQRAAVRAEKLRKKNSDDPRDWSRPRQIWEAYKETAKVDSKLHLYLALGALAGVVVAVLIGVLLNVHWLVTIITAILMAFLGATIAFTPRAKMGAYARYAGQPGSAQIAFSMLNAKKYKYSIGIAFNRELDLVHRVIGPSGVVLVGEGQAGRVKQLLAQEQRRHQQVLFGIPVTTIVMGDGAGQTKLPQLAKTIQKLPKAIASVQQTNIDAKLKSLDAVRPKVPLPKGPLPTMKGMNRAMRGR